MALCCEVQRATESELALTIWTEDGTNEAEYKITVLEHDVTQVHFKVSVQQVTTTV